MTATSSGFGVTNNTHRLSYRAYGEKGIAMAYGTIGILIKKDDRWVIHVDYRDGSEDYAFPTEYAARVWADRANILIWE